MIGVTRSHQAVFQWIHRIAEEAPNPPRARVVCATFDRVVAETGIDGMRRRSVQSCDVQQLRQSLKPSRVAVDETAVAIGTERYWFYAAIDVEIAFYVNPAEIAEYQIGVTEAQYAE